ncbi:MAG TPA: beta-ketoacyl synthase N-terminal-like domain-containing protein [Candidatus Sumerlaeota bacterium]|nr:beta-ketoacyl synthase N-terminal-like domain-containing protein [Candidatus Sumerlaeota bacterium]HPS03266.1 beta-ketoacyl synthase N-terminal-like domain-containing protein [Candidatus Sumerlaeota bacterium]
MTPGQKRLPETEDPTDCPPIPILGIGVACAAGNSPDAVRETLAGRRVPRIETERVATAQGTVELPVYRADAEELESGVPKRQLRRMSHFARLAYFTAFEARRDAGLDTWPDPARVGIAFGTGHGPLRVTFEFQDSVIDGGDRCASPTSFANSVHNAPASQISIAMGLQGPCQTITTLGQTFAGTLMAALDWLRHDEVDSVLAVVGDEYSPMSGYAYALAAGPRVFAPPIRPFDLDTCTSLPGEGVVAFLLGRPGQPGKYGAVRSVHLGTGEAELERQREAIRSLRAVLLAADGQRTNAPAYRTAVPADIPVAAHAGLYGSLAVGGGFEAFIGCLAMADGKLSPVSSPDSTPGAWNVIRTPWALGPEDRIGCLQCENGGTQSLVVIESPGG